MDNGKECAILIFKQHHSLCDGVSIMSLNLACSNDYGREYFVKGSDVSPLWTLIVRLSVPFYIPVMILQGFVGAMVPKNMATKNKNITGEINCASSSVLKFQEIKDVSKKLGVTINDLVSSSISVSLKKIFSDNNDPAQEVLVGIPANIRFKFYPTVEKVKLENKFSCIPIVMPLCENMEKALPKVSKTFKMLKSQFGMVYASYAVTRFM